jgi:hypothetical protein
MKNTNKLVNQPHEKNLQKELQVIELGKATELIFGNGNKRQESNRTPQITNIEKQAS